MDEAKGFGVPMRKECSTCIYGDRAMGGCGYLTKTGVSRLSLHGGDYRELENGPCQERVPGKPKRGPVEAWRMPPKKEGGHKYG